MKFYILIVSVLLLVSINTNAQYLKPKPGLIETPFQELPLGAIQAKGWLEEMLVRQKNGATGNLDKLYPLMNQRNGWLGGDGDQWERGPYWIDGLLPLAYILNDKKLIDKVKPWVEWSLKSQTPDGYFGPSKDYPEETGLQRDNSRDWWPKMVMLKVLKQYYSATGDKRVIKLMTNYFRYQLNELPKKPLDHWTYWAKYRGADNLMVVYWLYNITGDKFLLDLGEIIHKQSFDFTNAFLHTNLLHKMGSIHTVNLAQGMKEPLVYYQAHPESLYVEAAKKGFNDLRTFNGTANGLYGGDEALHGNNPTQGNEFCAAVEMMFTLESSLQITGAVNYADQLEKIAFNALPTQASDDYLTHQYFQQANQVMLTRQMRNFGDNHGGTDVCFGLLTGYPCCTSNMHQGWPKFTQNLWYVTPDDGIAALVYAPSQVSTKVAGNIPVTITEETSYPFEESVRFLIKTKSSVKFPFRLRIPRWCPSATIKVNGKVLANYKADQVVKIEQEWKTGDIVELLLPMHIFKTKWAENAMAVERGPITYALKIEEEFKKIKNTADADIFGDYTEVHPASPWNYGLYDVNEAKINDYFKAEFTEKKTLYPWNLENAPIVIKTKGRKIPSWKIYNDMAGPIPYSHIYGLESDKLEETITLVPYGCTTLRISQFPQVGRK
ncbi:beta-L-arabinofuranosidase domain-containing protein [Pedobacter agri]|uniref:beta-L-arabinofuranosidase domain-containing protein n=1 Tax=Pedobacter agri TaxID=454586 RepID=UPI0027824465|nr:beta-L-arabinofuranosidase domain-containing protein [Pedobacter agri]MDQ1139177.1 hypothetical protein [Pedobacter agri]